MTVEKDYEFVFDDGAVHRLQANNYINIIITSGI